MTNALKMAQAGVDAAIPDRNNPDAPVTEAIQNVLTWLFGSAGVGGAGREFISINTSPDQ